MVRHWALLIIAALALSACGIDGPPVPPTDEIAPEEAATEPTAAQPGGPEVTIGISGSIGGVVRR